MNWLKYGDKTHRVVGLEGLASSLGLLSNVREKFFKKFDIFSLGTEEPCTQAVMASIEVFENRIGIAAPRGPGIAAMGHGVAIEVRHCARGMELWFAR